MDYSEKINSLTKYIKESNKILIFTGAGISTGSGIPDFRGPGGVWSRRQPVYYDDFMTSEKSRIEHWDYKLEGWAGFKNARPNAAHLAIAKLESAGKLLKLVTQNIDGLHHKAGNSRNKTIEIHGTNLEVECQSCLKRFDPDPFFESFANSRKPPICPSCKGLIKPATISFGQQLRSVDIAEAEKCAQEADLVLSIGSTLSVYPAASVPLVAAELGVPYIIINRGMTEHDNHPKVKIRIEGDVVEILPGAVSEALE